MSTVVYLTIMLALVAILTAIIVPTLLFQKCPHCGARNLPDSTACRKCQSPLNEP